MPNWKKVIVSGSNAVLNHITASGHITALEGGFTVNTADNTELEVQGNISASGNLFADLTDANGSHNNTVMYDTTSGRFYFTGSYGGGGGDGTLVVANPGSPTDELTSITIGSTNFSIAGGGSDTDWFEATNYLTASKSVSITGSSNVSNTLEIKSSNPTSGTNIFRVVGNADEEIFSIHDNTAGTLFTVNDNSGIPIFSVEDNGNVTVDGNLIFDSTNGNGTVLIDDDLADLSESGNARGDIVKFGDQTLTPGNLVYWSGTSWLPANDSEVAARGALLGIAIGSPINNSTDQGVLIRGVVNIAGTSVVAGSQVYIGTEGGIPTTSATTTSGRCLRSIGHSISNDVIYFNPSPDFIIIA